MRLPRVRFTVQRMMLVVAILALLLWGGLVEIPRLIRNGNGTCAPYGLAIRST
jgi:hypothetical protein